jgi:hypothetical protein
MTDYVLKWIKQLAVMNTSASDLNPKIAVDSYGNSYVTYYSVGTVSGGTNSGGNAIIVFKLDDDGNMIWIKQTVLMNTTLTDVYPEIALDSLGNSYISYNTNGIVSGGTNIGSFDVVVFKLDTLGNVIWIKQTNVMNTGLIDLLPTIAVDTIGNCYVSYITPGTVSGGTFSGGSYDIVVFKLDSLGNLVWIKETTSMNTVGTDLSPTIKVDSSGNSYVAYYTTGTVSGGTYVGGNYNIVVFKLDSSGNMVWIKQTAAMQTINGGNYPTIDIDTLGNSYISYWSSGTASGGTFMGISDIIVFKLDSSGNVVWVKQTAAMNTTSDDTYPTVAVDSLGNCYVSYYTSGVVSGGTNKGGTDIVIFKLDSLGNMVFIKQQGVMNTTGADSYPSLSVDSSGNVYISYYTNGITSGGTNIGSNDVVVMKFGSSQTAPTAPLSVTATPGDTQANVSWLAPVSDGNSPITSYAVTSSPGSFTATSSTLSATVTGLTNGVFYTFTVIATNAIGDSPSSLPSAPVSFVKPPSIEIRPYVESQTITYYWSLESPNNYSTVSLTCSGPGGSTQSLAPIISSYKFTGLTNAIDYAGSLVAFMNTGASSMTMTYRTVQPGDPPSSPLNAVFTKVGNSIQVTWDPPSTPGGNIQWYILRTPDYVYEFGIESYKSSFISTEISPGTYTWYLQAINDAGYSIQATSEPMTFP